MKIDPASLSYQRPDGWTLVWGGPLTETATSIAVDDSNSAVYVSGYTNSESTLSSSKYDMLIMKVQANTGMLVWAKRVGSLNNDKANGVSYFNGAVYVVGESDSVGWANARTDMIFLKLDPTSASVSYSKYLGGSGED